MTNAVNVEFIVEKLLSFLATATDDHFRTDLVGQITQVCSLLHQSFMFPVP